MDAFGLAAGLAVLLALIGAAQAIAGWFLVQRFAASPPPEPADLPAVTILKPLYGDEPLLERALASVCALDYPDYQVVFGVQDPADRAIPVVHRLRKRFPRCDITLVSHPARHGENYKIGNLINMLPAAKHDVLVIADSDLHVAPDYLHHLVAALQQPGIGLATTLYAGLPADRTLPAQIGSTAITHGFLPGAVLARALGRQDCLGATMCLRRDTLERIGGLHALVDHLADDNVLGQLVRRLGLGVALAHTVPATTVPEHRLRALFRHELRWARTIRALVPREFVASALQYPLAWALLAVLLSGGAIWSIGCFLLVWLARAAAGYGIDKALEALTPPLEFSCPVWLLPVRDALSVVVMLASYAGTHVDWRGHSMLADTPVYNDAEPLLRSPEVSDPR